MKVKHITWSIDPVAKGNFFFTLYGNGMQTKISRGLTPKEMNRALGVMHGKGFVVLPQE